MRGHPAGDFFAGARGMGGRPRGMRAARRLVFVSEPSVATARAAVRRFDRVARDPIRSTTMLSVGQPAPAFSAATTLGGSLSLDDLRGRIAVIYFFRKAFTRNCTVETRGFRDNEAELRDLGAEVVGISSDSFPRQCEFAKATGVGFPMIADPDRTIARAYDVLFTFLPLAHRVTYVLDPRGVVAGVFNHEFQVLKHLDEVVRFVRRLAASSGATPRKI